MKTQQNVHMRKLITLMCCLLATVLAGAKPFVLNSPDGHLTVTIDGDRYTLRCADEILVEDAVAALTLADGTTIRLGDKVRRSKAVKGIVETIEAPFYRESSFRFVYNSLRIDYRNGWSMEWRATDEGIAYRFFAPGKVRVQNETVDIRFPGDRRCWLPYSTAPKTPYAMAFQNYYTDQKLSDGSRLPAFLPVTVDGGSAKVTLLESDLQAYPGMFVRADGTSLKGEFAAYPSRMARYRWRAMTYVAEREDWIAETDRFPWRILAVTTDDTQMPTNHLVYALAEPNRIGDTSWIRPGYSAWEWWNDWQLTGVPFEAGINMDTYRYYIDFASRNGLEYVILDEGWYEPAGGDMLTPIDALDLPELVRYAAERNVRLILWGVFNVMDDRCEEICRHYAEMGIAGFKIDFLDRDDQTAMEMIRRIAETAAKYHLVLDYHGISKPTGINRTYPNILNFESVFGQEEVRWAEPHVDMPLYNVTFPFIRQMAGYTDYTPGAMRNAARQDFKAVYRHSMSMGTRAHQVALYVVIDSPLTMLCDSPTLYEKDPATLEFISTFPRIYDTEKVLQGRLGEYIVIARKAGDSWYVGGLTSWTPREIDLATDFLGGGQWTATLFTDGPNAGRNASDYTIGCQEVGADSHIGIRLASGGGFAIKFTPKQ